MNRSDFLGKLRVGRELMIFNWPLLVALVLPCACLAQTLSSLGLSTDAGLHVTSFTTKSGPRATLQQKFPFFSLLLNDTLITSATCAARREADSVVFAFPRGLKGSVRELPGDGRGWQALITFVNGGGDTLAVANVVPFGEGPDRTYITAYGPSTYIYRLSRSVLFRPGLGPIGVVLPDNAWEMGYCDVPASPRGLPSRGGPASPALSLVAIARRTGSENASERRFKTTLPPGASVRYTLYADDHPGDWHEGVRLMFRDRWLYDLPSFNDSLYQRKDLEWIRHSYLMTLLFAWDEQYYDRSGGHYTFEQFLDMHAREFGWYDVFQIWPTWPRLGVDPRNQFDMYRDMPGGLQELRRQAEVMHRRGGKYFIAYNPWDESTRKEVHLKGMEDLLRRVDADGVVLDTWGESSREFQAAADRVKPGVVLYSEGQAVPKDMPGIVTGRVHDALYMPPPLNMHKVIKPENAIFRVMQVMEGRLHREAAVCLFNGYGIELNVMRTGRPDWMEDEYRYVGRVVKMLRDNSEALLSHDWVPLLPARIDSVWVNQWPLKTKTVYTVYGLRPEGFTGPLFEAPVSADRHYVSLWHHAELKPDTIAGKTWIPATVEGFSRAWLGTRREANVDCIAWLPRLLDVRRDADSLFVSSPAGLAPSGTRMVITAGDPSYGSRSVEFPGGTIALSLLKTFGRFEGKFVIQLFDGKELIDERTNTVELGTPRLISAADTTPRAARAPRGMTEIPAGEYTFQMDPTEVPNPVIPYPDHREAVRITMPRFFIDTYPVTNAEYARFLAATRYVPKDTVNFLRLWQAGKPPRGLENHPVVWVALEDARAYARWAGKRLPTDQEWQYAAQGTDGRKYPWGRTFDSTRCNSSLGHTTPVDAYPAGKSPFGVMDLVGNVWQLMNNVYDNVSYCFETMRGGSCYNPSSSEWYVKGGPWPVDKHQMLLLISPGFDRNATVGFRCVKDAQ